MSQMKRMMEDQEAARSAAEEILIKAGYFKRCQHDSLVTDEPNAVNKSHAFALATNYAKDTDGMTIPEMRAALDSVILDNGLCSECEEFGDED